MLEISLDLQSVKPLTPAGNLYQPQGITSDRYGTLIVCDTQSDSLLHLNPSNGNMLPKVKECGNHPFDTPFNVAGMGDDRLAVIDRLAKLHIF